MRKINEEKKDLDMRVILKEQADMLVKNSLRILRLKEQMQILIDAATANPETVHNKLIIAITASQKLLDEPQ